MAKRTVFVSDLTGNTIENPAKVTITYADPRLGSIVLDVDVSEVQELTARGRKQGRRGRPKAAPEPVITAA